MEANPRGSGLFPRGVDEEPHVAMDDPPSGLWTVSVVGRVEGTYDGAVLLEHFEAASVVDGKLSTVLTMSGTTPEIAIARAISKIRQHVPGMAPVWAQAVTLAEKSQ